MTRRSHRDFRLLRRPIFPSWAAPPQGQTGLVLKLWIEYSFVPPAWYRADRRRRDHETLSLDLDPGLTLVHQLDITPLWFGLVWMGDPQTSMVWLSLVDSLISTKLIDFVTISLHDFHCYVNKSTLWNWLRISIIFMCPEMSLNRVLPKLHDRFF